MAEKYQLTHPEGKKLSAIDLQKYLVIKEAITQVLGNGEPMSHTQLNQGVNAYLESAGIDFQGSVAWYTESVKLDLESKGIVLRMKEKQKLLFKISSK